MTTKIYVKILNEDILVWRLVKAKVLKDNICQIIDDTNFKEFDEILEFCKNDIVVCEQRNNNFFAVKALKKSNES